MSTSSHAGGIPVGDAPELNEEPNVTEMPDILRRLLDRLAALEGVMSHFETTRISDLSNTVSNLQQAQTTVQQSLNLLQSAHNALHEVVGTGTWCGPARCQGCQGETHNGRQVYDTFKILWFWK